MMLPIDSFAPLRAYEDLNGAAAYHLRLAPDFFDPIGSLALDPEASDVYYLPRAAEASDGDWMSLRFPRDVSDLAELLTLGFREYGSAPWCGAEMREDVLDSLADSEFYPPGSRERFENEGYVPFLEVHRITFFRAADTVLVCGRVSVDFNLDEHGVDIKLSAKGVEFGYWGDFDDGLLPEADWL